MADIQYLNYGDLQIELLAFNDIINDELKVLDYVNSQPWSEKRKRYFMDNYYNIRKRGITGASIEDVTDENGGKSTKWVLHVNGSDPEFRDKKDKEMQGEVAYFIQQQMSKLPTRSSLEEQKKKKEEEDKAKLPKYDSFGKNFINYVSLNYYGGNPIRTQEDWNILDERNPETGLRGTDIRIKRLSDYLKKYSDSLEEGKYNFEGSPFKDLTDLKTRINTAITKLNDGTWNLDDTDALNAIGLRSSDWFNNGSGDKFVADDGREYTYGDYYGKILPALKKAEAEVLAAKQKAAKQTAYNNTLFFNRVTNNKMLGLNGQALKEKYGNDLALRQALYNYSQNDIRTLSPEELSEVLGAYRYLAKDPIDSKLLKQLLSSSSGLYRNAAPNRFRKINGIDNLIWDSIAGLVIQINTRLQQQAILNLSTDLFKGVLTLLDKENEYLNSKIPGITNAEWKELSAIGLDIASILNPEAVSGSLMSLGAADLRRRAKNDSNPDWSFGDYIWQGVDYLTGALGGILVLGDLTLSAKTMATASKALPILRKIARAGAWYDLVSPDLVKDLTEASRKIINGEELTVKDWRAIGQGIRGLVSHGRLNRGNRAERRVLEKSGQNVTPENISSLRGKTLNYFLKLGFIRTKPTNTSEVSTIKATVNGKKSEIEISSNAKARIQEKVLKAGNNTEARNKAVKEVLESEGKIKASDKIEVEAPTYRDWKYAPGWFGTSRNLFGTKQVNSLQGNNVFNDYISGNRSYWDRYKYGSNTELKGIYNRLNINNSQLNNSQISKPSEETPKATESPKTTETSEKSIAELRKSVKSYLEGTAKHSGNNLSEEPFKAGDFNFEVNKFPNSSAGNIDISFNGNVMGNISFKNLEDMMKKVANFLKENRRLKDASGTFIKRINAKEMGEILKQLKAKGVFKQGGTIDKQKIQKYKEFIKK